ncbi:uncharacterized protein [Pagrus major]|uniref:uncharacterized protein n=1 Tax=Pagrus major TaxID=143350 RepID=UPI003CC88C2E
MSWDPYIVSLKQNPGVAEAAIFGKDGSVWSSTPFFKEITPDQIRALVAVPNMGSIITLAGVKAMVLRKEEDDIILLTTITMKSKTMEETQHLIIGITEKALVIGLGSPKEGCTAVVVERIAKHLKYNGY